MDLGSYFRERKGREMETERGFWKGLLNPKVERVCKRRVVSEAEAVDRGQVTRSGEELGPRNLEQRDEVGHPITRIKGGLVGGDKPESSDRMVRKGQGDHITLSSRFEGDLGPISMPDRLKEDFFFLYQMFWLGSVWPPGGQRSPQYHWEGKSFYGVFFPDWIRGGSENRSRDASYNISDHMS